MIVENEPYLIEYNVRMGDPECQTILPQLKTELIEIFIACCEDKLQEIDIQWIDQKSMCVVVCSNGYPDSYRKNIEIKNIHNLKLKSNDYLFHAGTKKIDDKIYAVGGRVLNIVSLSDSFMKARENVHNYLEILNWSDGFYRKDIGFKVISK